MKFILFFILVFSTYVQASKKCNGIESLCNQPYDKVVYPSTHNSFNYAVGPKVFIYPNQNYPIKKQLRDGIRGFMIDIHPYNGFRWWKKGQIYVCHSFCGLGGDPLIKLLRQFKHFLIQNPNEVVTLILESYVSPERVARVFEKIGLADKAWSYDGHWPTLGEMTAAGKNLVVLSDNSDGYPTWYHKIWDYTVETHYSVKKKKYFNCNYNRGNPDNSLFVLNHFLSAPFVRQFQKRKVNNATYLMRRSMKCYKETGKIPNFFTVDFYAQSDIVEVSELWNKFLVDPGNDFQY